MSQGFPAYRPVLLSVPPTAEALSLLRDPYAAMIHAQLLAVLDRTERSEFYPWIDTKIDLLTGKDLPARHPLTGRDVVSGWVQGRGLESIVTWARWLERSSGVPEVDRIIPRVRRLAGDLLNRLQEARGRNGGHLYFFMQPDCRAFRFETQNRVPLQPGGVPFNYSDLFSAKGMYAAAHYLDDGQSLEGARGFCMEVCDAIFNGAFASDQPEPARGAPAWIAQAHSHGPYMIALGMAALFARNEPGPQATALGLRLALHVLNHHVNIAGRWPKLQEYDMVEYVDSSGQPYRDAVGRIVSDPGHSLEYAGLYLKFSRLVLANESEAGALRAEVQRIAALMPALLQRNFANGFRPDVGGICKTVDLLSRQPIDATMPWWSLPETIRAALACWRIATVKAERDDMLAILARCHNAFTQHYVRPDIHLMAVKVRDADGSILDFMPAYPDADPGYHTALSLMDALDLIADR